MCIPTTRELPYITDFLKIAESIVVHFAHICAYGVETVKQQNRSTLVKTAKICQNMINIANSNNTEHLLYTIRKLSTLALSLLTLYRNFDYFYIYYYIK